MARITPSKISSAVIDLISQKLNLIKGNGEKDLNKSATYTHLESLMQHFNSRYVTKAYDQVNFLAEQVEQILSRPQPNTNKKPSFFTACAGDSTNNFNIKPWSEWLKITNKNLQKMSARLHQLNSDINFKIKQLDIYLKNLPQLTFKNTELNTIKSNLDQQKEDLLKAQHILNLVMRKALSDPRLTEAKWVILEDSRHNARTKLSPQHAPNQAHVPEEAQNRTYRSPTLTI